VVQCLPLDATVVQGNLRGTCSILVLFRQQSLRGVAQLRELNHLAVQVLHAVAGHDAARVHVTVRGEIDFAFDGAGMHDLLHHSFLGGGTVAAANEFDVLHLGDRLALGVLTAVVALRDAEVRSTLLVNHVSVFEEEAVELGPTAIAALSHVVARHHLLG